MPIWPPTPAVFSFDRAIAALTANRAGRWSLSLWLGIREHHAARAASAMAFDLFLASIPMLALLGWASATLLRQDPGNLAALSSLLDVAPHEVTVLIERHLGRFANSSVAPIVVLAALWIAGGAFHTVMSVLETALQAPRRPWWKKRLVGLACVLAVLAAPVGGAVVTVLVAGGPLAVLGALVGGEVLGAYWLGLIVAGATLATLVAAFLRYAVERPGVRRRVWPGTVVTLVCGTIASSTFAYYAHHFARYATLYGSLAAIAIVLLWLWFCCASLLLGAEINAQLEGMERSSMPDGSGTISGPAQPPMQRP